MIIAEVAPLYESVPPKLYGGTERIVSYLTEELVRLGHDITLFASGDSVTSARLIANAESALRLDKNCRDHLSYHIAQLKDVMDAAHEFDIIHFNNDYLHYPFSSMLDRPYVTTLHGRLDLPELQQVYKRFSGQPVISISNAQRIHMPVANWISTVYHGIPADLLQEGKGDGGYLAFLGRISPEKGVDKAIEIAKMAGQKIKIAAKIDKVDELYFQEHISHLLDDPIVDFIGEINEEEKTDFLGKASALIFPIDWPEPFGLVMIESIACGTPVIAFNRGSIPEVIDDGITGFIVESVAEAVEALQHKLVNLNRGKIRKVFEERFTAERMALDYLHVFEALVQYNRKSQITKTRNDIGAARAGWRNFNK